MASNNIAWMAIKDAEASGSLPKPQHHLYFRNPRPLFELYDLKKDPFQLNNLSGKARLETTEIELREKLDRWMIREGDYLPLPSHARVVLRK
mgnify:FL=1